MKLRFEGGKMASREVVVVSDITLGRATDSGIVLSDSSVSTHHASIVFRDGVAQIVDNGATNGVVVNGQKTLASPLRLGDSVELGDVRLVVIGDGECDDAGGAPPSASNGRRIWRCSRRCVVARRAVAVAIILAVAGYLLQTSGCRRQRGMVLRSSLRATSSGFKRGGVELTLRESEGVERLAEAVTSGLPLPKGMVRSVQRLRLLNEEGVGVACQIIPQALWPDGSLKWVLLDFQADLPAKGVATYKLKRGSAIAPRAQAVNISFEGVVVKAENGLVSLEICRDKPGLIHRVVVNGEERIVAEAPVDTVLMDEGGRCYRASIPREVVIETAGAMRSVILLRGEFVAEGGERIHSGKVGV